MSEIKTRLTIGSDNLELSAVELEYLVDILTSYCDEGPGDYGWQSSKLLKFSSKIEVFVSEKLKKQAEEL